MANVLTFPTEFDNAAWTKTGSTVTANATTAPDTTSTADELVENSAGGVHTVHQDPTLEINTLYTFSVYAKADERSIIYLDLRFDSAEQVQVWFDLSLGTFQQISVPARQGIVVMTDAGDGWYFCSVTKNSGSGVVFGFSRASIGLATAFQAASYTGDGASGAFLWNANLDVAVVADAQVVPMRRLVGYSRLPR